MNSKGHVTYIGQFEYFTDANNDLFRADKSNPFDCRTGYRLGGHFECPKHLIEMCLQLAKQASRKEKEG